MQRYASSVVLLVLAILSLAGCRGGAASPSPSAQATASLEPTAAATASATPSPTVKPPATLSAEHFAVLEAMAAKMEYPKGSYRVDATVRMSVGVVYNYVIDYAVSGADMDMTMDMSSGDMQIVMRMVAKGNLAYVKLDQNAWTSMEIDASVFEAMTDEWAFVTEPGNFVFVRADTLDGQDVLIFTNARPIPRPTEDNAYMSDVDVYMTEMTMMVLPDGTPLSMHSELEGTATVSYRGRDVSGQVDYEFSDVGKPIKIVAPKV